MDANEYRIASLEECSKNLRREIDEMKAVMHKTSNDVHEAQLAFVEFSTKIDTIHQILERNHKSNTDWARWIPGVLFGGVAMVIALLGKMGV